MQNPINISDDNYLQLDDLYTAPLYRFKNKYLKDYRVFSHKVKDILLDLKKLASTTNIPLLITGPTGSGKELVAQFMHYEADRSKGEYIAINCTNMNKDMFESELFGYKGGAYTGARREGQHGYIKQAEGGTLFLDEIGEINLDLQAKLLRMLEEREYYPVGSNYREKVNCRMVFATNKDLETMLEKGHLREDLYYRLNVVKAEMPPLAERKEEILPFVAYFIKQMNRDFQKNVNHIQGKVLKFFQIYKWPGNIRELKNLIMQIMVFIEGESITFDHLKKKDELDRIMTESYSGNLGSEKRSQSEIIGELIKEPFDLEKFTMEIVKATLNKFNGNKSKTAKFLGLKREQLYNRYKID